jgi:hypothetical protein
MILVEFKCTECASRSDYWTPSPPPALVRCARCGGESAKRVWSAVSLGGRRAQPVSRDTADSVDLCRRYPQIPGLCHMTPSAQRRWVATYLGDGRAVDSEIEKQERAAKVGPPTMADAISPHHHGPALPQPIEQP